MKKELLKIQAVGKLIRRLILWLQKKLVYINKIIRRVGNTCPQSSILNPQSFLLQKGFTLIEMLIVITVLGIVSDIAGMMIFQAARITTIQYALTSVQGQGRLAATRMTREIRMMKTVGTYTAGQLSFKKIDGSDIDYTLSNNILYQNAQPLSEKVESLIFEYFDADGVSTNIADDIRFIKINMVLDDNGNSVNMAYTIFLPHFEGETPP